MEGLKKDPWGWDIDQWWQHGCSAREGLCSITSTTITTTKKDPIVQKG
jgi:hypothetical protein